MVAVEVHRGLVGGSEEGGGRILAAETANHGAGVQGPIAYLQEVVVGLGGEVEELNVGSWDKKKKQRERIHLSGITTAAAAAALLLNSQTLHY